MRLLLLVAAVWASLALADEEASNVAHVVASQYGRCYARSVPTAPYEQEGSTRVYVVEPSRDRLVYSFNWFSQSLYLECNVSAPGQPVAIAVVRLGPWQRGHQASATDLAVAFYWGGKLVKQYSTLDIAGSPDNVSASVSHYQVLDKIEGLKWQGGNQYSFEVVTTDGRRLAFDVATGERMQVRR
jgi:hypothetical protein